MLGPVFVDEPAERGKVAAVDRDRVAATQRHHVAERPFEERLRLRLAFPARPEPAAAAHSFMVVPAHRPPAAALHDLAALRTRHLFPPR